MGGGSCSKGCGFKSQYHILDGHFSHLFVVIIEMFVWKDENKWKNVHPVYGAGIRTHDLLNMSLLQKPLDQAPAPPFSFLFSSFSHSHFNYYFNNKIVKSVNGVLGIQSRGLYVGRHRQNHWTMAPATAKYNVIIARHQGRYFNNKCIRKWETLITGHIPKVWHSVIPRYLLSIVRTT